VVGGVAGAVIGPPDAGKTSAARLMRADRLLSDDMVAVSWAGREPRLHATPLGRESDGMGSAPLRAVFFPSKQTAFSLRRVLHTEALAWTVAGQGEYLSALFRPCLQAAIANLSRLLRTIPAYELGFSLDDFDHEAVRRVLLPG
jgi:hypothetical protein